MSLEEDDPMRDYDPEHHVCTLCLGTGTIPKFEGDVCVGEQFCPCTEQSAEKKMRAKKQKPVCEECGAPATRANLGPRTGQMNYVTGKVVETNNPSYLCETDFETYKLSHSFLDVSAWLRLESKR